MKRSIISPTRALALGPLMATLLSALCPGQAGTLDPSFGDGGKLTTDFLEPGSIDQARAVVAVQADGKIVVAGSRNAGGHDFALARYLPDGALDTAFGNGGTVITDLGGSDLVYALAIQPDGMILAAGSTGSDFAIARYLPDGSLDAAFGTGGVVLSDLGTSREVVWALALQSDGRIVAAGDVYHSSSTGLDFALARYLRDGSLDASFGTGGSVTTHLGTSHNQVLGVALQPDGRIVAAGYAYASSGGTEFVLARYLADGSLDPTFDGDGAATVSFGSSRNVAMGVALQADGKIVATGYTRPGASDLFGVVRLLPDGSLDPTFGGDGRVTTEFGSGNDWPYAVAVAADGKIVAGGTVLSSSWDFGLVRYLPDGGLDPGFGSAGMVVTDFGGGTLDWAYAMALQADGKVVAAGQTYTTIGVQDFAVARYDGDGNVDVGFDANGKVATDLGGSSRYDRAYDVVAAQADGKMIAVGFTAPIGGGMPASFALTRYDANGVLDSTFGSGGKVTTDFGGTAWAEAVAIQADGRIVAAGNAFTGGSNDFALARYHAGGSLDTSFGGGGIVKTDVDGGVDQVHAVAIQADGKIVAAGHAGIGRFDTYYALIRYLPDGRLDPTFGDGGIVLTDLGGSRSERISAVAIQTDGRIVALGGTALVRYDPGGGLDATFGTAGIVHTGSVGAFSALGLQADGRIVVAGSRLARYLADGSLDPTFGSGGAVDLTILGASAVALPGDGRILVGGASLTSTHLDFALARYGSDGSLDPTFGTDGVVTTDFAQGFDLASGLALQASKILMGGMAQSSDGDFDFALARYHGFTSVLDLLEQLGQRVENLAAANVLNHGQARSLESKVEGAIAQVDRGNDGAAANKIVAFMNDVNGLVAGNVLTAAQGQDLYDRAAVIVALLSP